MSRIDSDNGLDELLRRTSRTFALAIPCLPEPLRAEVAIAYLLFRVADTIEDATNWDRQTKLRAFDRLAELMAERDSRATTDGWPYIEATPNVAVLRAELWATHVVAERQPCDNEDYLTLLRQFAPLYQAAMRLDDGARQVILSHVQRTILGMRRFVADTAGETVLQVGSMAQLQDYCYQVAGIVGEMLTELFLRSIPQLAPQRTRLRTLAVRFGEGLQLVNIIKDSSCDALEGRLFQPEGVSRLELMQWARRDLVEAANYVSILRTARVSPGLVAFAAFPLRLAHWTLNYLEAPARHLRLTRGEVRRVLRETLRECGCAEPQQHPGLSAEPGSSREDGGQHELV